MSPMDEKMTFSVKEVCEIIDACHKGGVSVFKLGGLYLKRSGPGAPIAPAEPIPLTPEEEFAQKRAEAIAFEVQQEELKREQLANMRIEDPEQYEELVLAKELEHASGQEADGVGA